MLTSGSGFKIRRAPSSRPEPGRGGAARLWRHSTAPPPPPSRTITTSPTPRPGPDHPPHAPAEADHAARARVGAPIPTDAPPAPRHGTQPPPRHAAGKSCYQPPRRADEPHQRRARASTYHLSRSRTHADAPPHRRSPSRGTRAPRPHAPRQRLAQNPAPRPSRNLAAHPSPAARTGNDARHDVNCTPHNRGTAAEGSTT